MIVYLRRRPLLLFSIVHTNIPLRLPLRNVIRKSSIHRRSIVTSVPLLPAKATEGAGVWLLLRPQRCTVAAVVPLLLAKAREWAVDSLPLLPQRCTVAAAVVSHQRFRMITMTTAVLRRRPRNTRRAHLRLVPGSSASLAPDSQSRAAVMWPQLPWPQTKQMLRWWMTVPLKPSSSPIICHLNRLIS